MLEDLNDNLSEETNLTDGNEIIANETESAIENEEVKVEEVVTETIEEVQNETVEVVETASESIEEIQNESVEIEEVVAETEVLEPIVAVEDDVMSEIANTTAAESEDETIKASNDFPMQDFEAMPMETLVVELEKYAAAEKVMAVKDHVEEIKKAFLSKYFHLLDEKKQEFLVENPETNETFQYNFPLKTKFDTVYNDYREKKNNHFKSLQNNLQANLKNRLAIVEELKNLVQMQDGVSSSLKQLNDIRDRWKNAGAIPKDKYNHVWNNYHFHIENFYDFLHLDREARDIDFKHNLELKQKIVARVEELVNETDINKSFRELQDLHKIWKEDIGPVSRDHREEIWKKFSDLTKIMHDKREAHYESFRGVETENLTKKQEIVAGLVQLSTEKVATHAAWSVQVEKVEALRNQFFATGKVPSEVNESTWQSFKNAVRDFNVLKNSFYKDIKKDQNDNLSKKQALVAKANELKDSEDFEATTILMKQIQEDWKLIGHVPRKISEVLWTDFRAACNHYFERLKNNKKEEDPAEVAAFENKKSYLETLRGFELIGDHKTDLDGIKSHIEAWKNLGRVPFNRRHIEGKFNKILDALFEKLSASKKDVDKARFSNKLDRFGDDSRKLDGEKIFTMRKIDELQHEIFQLENNIQFFQNTKNAKKENSIVLEVRKNIEIHKQELQTWKDKLKQIRELANPPVVVEKVVEPNVDEVITEE